VRNALAAVSTLVGADITPTVSTRRLGADELANALAAMAFPGPYQLFSGPHLPIALCAVYEQTWQLAGYTRGELVGSLALAPGERATLEVHSWDKSSRRSEEELSVDFELRTAEKSTQRDALTVAQEYAQQTDTSVRADLTIPVPKLPIGVSAQTATQTRDSLRRTTEQLRERMLEASTTLKLNRRTRVEISREVGREEKQTRVLENTNRCHTLNCHYFEVVANHVVRTRLADIRPVALLRYSRPVFTLDWILCHQGVLVRSLLDRTFLPGFEGARQVKVAATVADMQARARLAELDSLGELVRPLATAIDRSYGTLTDTRDAADEAFADLGPGSASAIANRLGALGLQRLFSYFGLQPEATSALDGLTEDLADDGNPASALRALLTLTSPDLPPRPNTEVSRTLNNRYETWGGTLDDNEVGTRFGVEWDLLTYDDAGLRAAVRAAAGFLARAPIPGTAAAVGEQAVDPELAQAQVEYERLRCHLDEHWLHYAQAVWAQEDRDQRLLRLQAYGPLVALLDNQLLGFYGDRGAFPLRDPSVVAEVDLPALLKSIRQDLEADDAEPMLVSLPTPGVLLEATTGECNACEDYIHDSRAADLRTQTARAEQEEAEAQRRRERIAQQDLSDPLAHNNHLIVELQQDVDSPNPGGP
jgi:hypothetical protein